MGSSPRLVTVLAFLAIISYNDAFGVSVIRTKRGSNCPPVNQVRGPPCRENYDCTKGPCCPNSLGLKSCVDSVPFRGPKTVAKPSSRCPPPNQVRGPVCREDYDCKKGPCCPNSFGKKNCVNTVPWN